MCPTLSVVTGTPAHWRMTLYLEPFVVFKWGLSIVCHGHTSFVILLVKYVCSLINLPPNYVQCMSVSFPKHIIVYKHNSPLPTSPLPTSPLPPHSHTHTHLQIRLLKERVTDPHSEPPPGDEELQQLKQKVHTHRPTISYRLDFVFSTIGYFFTGIAET